MTPPSRLGAGTTRTAFLGFALAVLTACGSSTEPAKTPPKDTTPATITASSTDTLRAAAGAPVATSLTVTVKNAAGSPIDSAVVVFAVVSGGGTLSATSVRTDLSGQATTSWTLGPTVGTQIVTAASGTLPPVTFVAIAAAGAASAIAKIAGDAQTGLVNTNLPILPSVKVTDRLGNPVAGQLVTFTAGSNGGLVNGGIVNTGADGIATITGWRLGGTVGTYTITASAGSTVTTTFTATAVAGPPAVLTITPVGPFALEAGQTVKVTPRVTDAAGNVLAAPITYSSANPGVATAASDGTITAFGAGITTITVSSGAAFATATVSVTGHPVGTSVSSTLVFNATPSNLVITNSIFAVGLQSAQQIAFVDPSGTSNAGNVVQLTSGVPILLGGRNSTGPLLAVNPAGSVTRVAFVDQAAQAVIDSLDITENVINAGGAINSTGTRAFFALSNGQLATIDVPGRTQLARIDLGGGTTKVKIDRGDTLVYVLTNVGVMFEIDARSNSVKRQIILPPSAGSITDFDISRDGNTIFLLDGIPGVVRVYNITTFNLLRSVQVSPAATTVTLSPDDQQIWVTHSSNQVTWYTGTVANGYLSTGALGLLSTPLGVYFSPTGSFAAIAEIGGTVEIIR